MSYFKRVLALIAVVLMPFTLSACFFPEEFICEVEISRNGTFTFSYDGVLTSVLGRADELKNGGLSPNANRQIAGLKKLLQKDDGFKHVKYLGNSKFEVLYKKEGSLDVPFYFIGESVKIFSIIQKKSGLVEVIGRNIVDDVRKLEALKFTIDGELTVKTDGEVVDHNADSTPRFLGLVGGYGWKIKSINDPQPIILIKVR